MQLIIHRKVFIAKKMRLINTGLEKLLNPIYGLGLKFDYSNF